MPNVVKEKMVLGFMCTLNHEVTQKEILTLILLPVFQPQQIMEENTPVLIFSGRTNV